MTVPQNEAGIVEVVAGSSTAESSVGEQVTAVPKKRRKLASQSIQVLQTSQTQITKPEVVIPLQEPEPQEAILPLGEVVTLPPEVVVSAP